MPGAYCGPQRCLAGRRRLTVATQVGFPPISAPLKILLATGAFVALASIMSAAPAAAAGCVGAASRDPKHPCTNPTLSVFPSPAKVDSEPGTPCPRIKKQVDPTVCTFGARASRARDHFAIVGDSHVSHWRAALDVIGKVKRWQGFSMLAPACYFSEAVKQFPEGPRESCTAWYRSVLAWLADHPEVSTLFVTQNASTPIVAKPGQTARAVKVAGFQRTWKNLPKTVKHIVVIRDNPKSTPDAINCVRDVAAAGTQPAGLACAVPRRVGIQLDTAAIAAKRLRSRRYQVIDLTHYFCSTQQCFPAIGGILVNRDSFGHITQSYTRTLAPYMLRKLRGLMKFW